jgi:hypothetical protein
MAEPMKTRSAQSILGTYKTVHSKLCNGNHSSSALTTSAPPH